MVRADQDRPRTAPDPTTQPIDIGAGGHHAEGGRMRVRSGRCSSGSRDAVLGAQPWCRCRCGRMRARADADDVGVGVDDGMGDLARGDLRLSVGPGRSPRTSSAFFGAAGSRGGADGSATVAPQHERGDCQQNQTGNSEDGTEQQPQAGGDAHEGPLTLTVGRVSSDERCGPGDQECYAEGENGSCTTSLRTTTHAASHCLPLRHIVSRASGRQQPAEAGRQTQGGPPRGGWDGPSSAPQAAEAARPPR